MHKENHLLQIMSSARSEIKGIMLKTPLLTFFCKIRFQKDAKCYYLRDMLASIALATSQLQLSTNILFKEFEHEVPFLLVASIIAHSGQTWGAGVVPAKTFA